LTDPDQPKGGFFTRDDLGRFRRVTVMGLGRFGGGAGAARYFANLGAEVTVTDRDGPEKLAPSLARLRGLGIRFVLGGHRPEDFANADLVIANQAVRPENEFLRLARRAGVPVATETGLALGLNRSPWAAVTGTAGKSTVAAMLAAMLAAGDSRTLFGGNIGGDLITRVENRPGDAPLVVELSSYQLIHLAADFAAGRILPPRVAVVTNISPNHLDWHRDLEEYARSKLDLVNFLPPGGQAVLDADDRRLREFAAAGTGDGFPGRRIVRCAWEDPGGDDACFAEGGRIVLRRGGRPILGFSQELVRPPGRHNRMNAILAAAAAYAMRPDADAVVSGIAAFPGLPHRLERAGVAGGRRFVNDSKSTTPGAAILALEAVEGPKALIAGGYDKHSPFAELGRAIQAGASGLVLLGEAGPRLGRAVLDAAGERPAESGPLPVIEAGEDFALAVREAFRLTPPGGTVLLSPACASWGMFANYEERGEAFRRLAEELGRSC
jgi:UDP-N-acetylmuramoylalanine--D-glutamate ligase